MTEIVSCGGVPLANSRCFEDAESESPIPDGVGISTISGGHS